MSWHIKFLFFSLVTVWVVSALYRYLRHWERHFALDEHSTMLKSSCRYEEPKDFLKSPYSDSNWIYLWKFCLKLLSIVGPVNTDSFYLAFTRTEGGQHRSIFSCRSWHASMQNGKKNCFCFIIRECVLNSRGEIVACLCLEALVWG